MTAWSLFKQKSKKKPKIIQYESNGKFGLKQGKYFVTEPIYDEMRYVENALKRVVCIRQKWGCINNEGDIIIPIIFEMIEANKYSVFLVNAENKNGVYAYSGKEIVPPIYNEVLIWGKNLFKVSENNKYGILLYHENSLISTPIIFDDATICKKNMYVKVRIGNRFGIVDFFNNYTIPVVFDEIDDFSDYCIYRTVKDNKYSIYDYAGKIITKYKYDYIDKFNNKIALVKIDNMWGMIDYRGNELIKTQFDKLSHFNSQGLAEFEINNIKGYVKRKDIFDKKNND